jgi:hypothetical protein
MASQTQSLYLDFPIDESVEFTIGMTIQKSDQRYLIVNIMRSEVMHLDPNGKEIEGYARNLAEANEWRRYNFVVEPVE